MFRTLSSYGRLGHSVYRKSKHTKRYLHAHFHYHPAQKFSVVNTMATRAISVFQNDDTQIELPDVGKCLWTMVTKYVTYNALLILIKPTSKIAIRGVHN